VFGNFEKRQKYYTNPVYFYPDHLINPVFPGTPAKTPLLVTWLYNHVTQLYSPFSVPYRYQNTGIVHGLLILSHFRVFPPSVLLFLPKKDTVLMISPIDGNPSFCYHIITTQSKK
jgi:hypothetical protein